MANEKSITTVTVPWEKLKTLCDEDFKIQDSHSLVTLLQASAIEFPEGFRAAIRHDRIKFNVVRIWYKEKQIGFLKFPCGIKNKSDQVKVQVVATVPWKNCQSKSLKTICGRENISTSIYLIRFLVYTNLVNKCVASQAHRSGLLNMTPSIKYICNLNSAIQLLFSCNPFMKRLKTAFEDHDCVDESQCFVCILQETFDRCSSQMQPVALNRLRKLLAMHHPTQFQINERDDARECIQFLLTLLDAKTKIVNETFDYEYMQKLSCKSCGAKSYTQQFERVLMVDIEEGSTQASIEKEINCILEIGCECGHNKKNLTRTFTNPPEALLIALTIFEYDDWGCRKRKNINFQCSPQIDLSRFWGKGDLKYKLVATIQHLGLDEENAHYVATDDKFVYNDSSVKMINTNRDLGNTYVMLYERTSVIANKRNASQGFDETSSKRIKTDLMARFKIEENVASRLENILSKQKFKISSIEHSLLLLTSLPPAQSIRILSQFEEDVHNFKGKEEELLHSLLFAVFNAINS